MSDSRAGRSGGAENAPAGASTSSRTYWGFRARFSLALSLLVVTLMGVTAFRIFTKERSLLEESLVRRGEQVVSLFSKFLVEPLFSQNFVTVRQIADELDADDGNVYAIVLDHQGFVVAQSQHQHPDPEQTDSWCRAIVDHFVSTGQSDQTFQQDVYLRVSGRWQKFKEFARPVRLGNQILGYARVGFDTRGEIERPVEENQHALVAIFFPGILAGILLAALLANLIIGPVRALVVEAWELAGGNYDRIVELAGPYEIQILADAFNNMRHRIHAQFDQIQSANDELDRKVFELEVLFDSARAMNFKSYSPELIDYLLDTASRALEAEWSSLMLLDETGERLIVSTVRGSSFDRHLAPHLQPGEGIAGLAFEKGEVVVANEGFRDPRFSRIEGNQDVEDCIRQIVCAPLLVESCPIGVLNVVNKIGSSQFTESDARLLMALSSLAARAIESAKLYDMAIRECKTGLFVPSYFEARVAEQITASKRFEQNCALIMLDVDHFKLVNDTYGHICGDEVLIKISRFIKETLREGIDVASRFGGEEFSILLPRTEADGAFAFGERLRLRIEREVGSPELGPERVTVSVGISIFPTHGQTVSDLKLQADQALYRAKDTGRNRVLLAVEDSPANSAG